jgi:hypothetical protein
VIESSSKNIFYDDIDTLHIAKEQFILSLKVRAVYNGCGNLECNLAAVALGPWSIGKKELNKIDHVRASWALERVSTQNLAITLDSLLQKHKKEISKIPEGYLEYVRCLRNAFAHDPFMPKWELKDKQYRRKFRFCELEFDLRKKHNVFVEPNDYFHAGGLIKLVDIGLELLSKKC